MGPHHLPEASTALLCSQGTYISLADETAIFLSKTSGDTALVSDNYYRFQFLLDDMYE